MNRFESSIPASSLRVALKSLVACATAVLPAILLALGTQTVAMWPTTVEASQGQCRWEGGPGAPTHPTCAREDCIGNGGQAQCTEPVLRPTLGYTEAQVDGNLFGHNMCDVAPPSIGAAARWCIVEGGEWRVENGVVIGCFGRSAQYPNGGAIDEAAADAASDLFADFNSSCPPSVKQDSGWGFDNSADVLCGPAHGQTKNGYIISDVKRRRYTRQAPCDGIFDVVVTRHRRLVCPDTTFTRYKSNGDLQCYIPATCPEAECGATGNKQLSETDYRSSGRSPLGLARYYNSGGYFRLPGAPDTSLQRDDFWRTNFDRRILRVSGNSQLTAVQRREDGTLRHFDGAGKEVLNRDGGSEQLQDLGASGWRLTRANSDVELYDSVGRLTSITSREGLQTTLGYDVNGLLDLVVDQFGHSLDFTYTSGRLASVTLPGGGQITYGYDSVGRPTGVTYPDATVRGYHYEDTLNPWLLTGITDESTQRFITYTYDGAGHIIQEERAGGANRYQYQYTVAPDLTIGTGVTDPLGKIRQLVHRNQTGVMRLASSSAWCMTCKPLSISTFDANGNYASQTDLNGKRTSFTFDPARNLETSRSEGMFGNGSATPVSRTITTAWNATHRLPDEIAVYTGGTATGTPLRKTTFTRDTDGNVLTRTITDTTVTPNKTRTWTYTYDTYGRVLTEDGPRTDVSDVTTYTYYTCNVGYECGQIETVTNALNQTTTYNTYNAHGQPLTITDPNGVVTTLTYDARQRPTSRQVGSETTTIEYWPTGLTKKATQPDGSYILFTYDGAQRLTQIEDGLGNRTTYTLDGMGNRIAESDYDPSSALVRSRSRLFNTLGQIWQELTSAGTGDEATVFGYDANGNQTTIEAPLSRNTTQVYDELNRLKQTIDPALGNTFYAYDANHNLTQVTDPRGLSTTYQYNGFGQVKQQTSPDTGTTTNTFDDSGNVLTVTSARGAITTNSYDALNRVNSSSFRIGSTTDQTITYTYDAGANGKGRLTGASDSSHSLSWGYDAHGRATSKIQTVGGVARNVTYAYTDGQLASMTTPSGQTISYSYDSGGHLEAIAVNGSTLLNNALHDPFGPVVGWSWSNGTLMARSYDVDGRLTMVDSAGLSTYTFYEDGRIRSRADENPASYALPNGTTTTTVAPASNRILATTGVLERTYAYDPAGNVTGQGGATLTYNFANRLSSATKDGVTTSYVYNALGQRVRKSSTVGSRLFVYDEAGHLLGEYDAAGALIQETVWFGDIPVATLRPNGGGGVNVFYIHTDHLNTPRRISRPSDNAVVWRWDSDPYGSASPDQDADGDSSLFVYDLRFAGQYFDAEAGLHYNYFRDYDPQMGRYVESDPIGLKGGINTYAYAKGNPVVNDDPLGLLVRGRGCSSKGWKRIQDAEGRIRKELSKLCECTPNSNGSCIPCDIRGKLLNALDTSTVDCGLSTAFCGEAPAPGNYVRIYDGAFDDPKGCKCVALSLYHELLHNVGFHDPDIYSRFEGPCIGPLCNMVSPDASN